jgi:AraC-like DNA-binding protein
MKLYIKNMVSLRCKILVKQELDKLGLQYEGINLGEVRMKEQISAQQYEQLKNALLKSGLELTDDKKNILVEKIKNIIVEMVHYEDEMPRTKNSVYISEKLNLNYTYLANLFSRVTGKTIEHYIIAQRIERAKELLLYDDLSASQIYQKLNYSSLGHLSNQFKKITSLTPSFFKKMKHKRLIPLESL